MFDTEHTENSACLFPGYMGFARRVRRAMFSWKKGA